jgi:osmotically-inducible protein OsmY
MMTQRNQRNENNRNRGRNEQDRSARRRDQGSYDQWYAGEQRSGSYQGSSEYDQRFDPRRRDDARENQPMWDNPQFAGEYAGDDGSGFGHRTQEETRRSFGRGREVNGMGRGAYADGDAGGWGMYEEQQRQMHSIQDRNRSRSQADQDQRGQHYGKGPKGYKRSDERIRDDVNEALYLHDEIDASEIEVDVQNGEVTLRGMINSRHTKRMAEEAIEYLSGVKEVHNQLRVEQTTNKLTA